MSRLVVRAAVTVMLVSTATWMVPGPTVTATVLDPPGDDEGGGQAGRLGGPGPGSAQPGPGLGRDGAGDSADQDPSRSVRVTRPTVPTILSP